MEIVFLFIANSERLSPLPRGPAFSCLNPIAGIICRRLPCGSCLHLRALLRICPQGCLQSQAHPRFDQGRGFHRLSGGCVETKRCGLPCAGVAEAGTTRVFKLLSRCFVGLEIKGFAAEDGNEQPVAIHAMPAEHPLYDNAAMGRK